MQNILWNSLEQRVDTAQEDQPLLNAALRCFRAPGTEALTLLESLLSASPDMLMRQCVLVLQAANAVLDEEGEQLTPIFAQQGKPIVCKAGCARCCQQLVLCRPFEAQLIKVFLHATSGALSSFAQAYAQWDKATSPIRRSYLAWAEAFYGRGEDDGSHAVEDFQAPCPFLDTQNCCTIYPVRPYACRTCIALDPACPAPPLGHNGLLHMQYSLYTSHHASRQALVDLLLRKLGASPAPMAMPEMVASLCHPQKYAE